MSNATLAFSLGLEGGQFLRTAKAGQSAIAGIVGAAAKFTGITAAIGAAFEAFKQGGNIVEGVFAAFERGADLERLHARTGESVQDLFLLQKGFKAVGMESGDVGTMLFHLQKSLSGMSSDGEETASAFSMLGLSMQQIRALNGPAQFQAIAASINHLDRASADVVAGKLFGREGAQNFLQLARSGKAFGQALKDNAAAAAEMARNAAAFNQIELSIGRLKGKAQNLFAGIAEGAAPGIQKVLDLLNKIDFTSIGQKIGNVLGVITQSIEDHKFGELLKLSLNAGLEGFQNYFVALMAGINAAMQKLFENLLENSKIIKNFVLGIGQYNVGRVQEVIGGIRAAATGSASGYDLLAKGQKNVSGAESTIFKSFADAGKGTGDVFAKAFEQSLKGSSSQFQDALKKFFTTESARFSAQNPGGSDDIYNPSKNSTLSVKPFDFTSVEKMGFHFGNGGPSLLQDHAAATARNTARTAVAVETVAKYLAGNAAMSGLPPFLANAFPN